MKNMLMVSVCAVSILTVQANPVFEAWKKEAQTKTPSEMICLIKEEIATSEDIEVIIEGRRQINEVYKPMVELENKAVNKAYMNLFEIALCVGFCYLSYKCLLEINQMNLQSNKELCDRVIALRLENEALKNAQCWWFRKAS